MSGNTPTDGSDLHPDPGDVDADPAGVEELVDDLDALADDVDSTEAHEEIRATRALLVAAHERGLIGSNVRRLRARDVAEAFVGSVIFASPLLVEDGVFDIADHLFGFTLHGVPVFLVANTLFVVLMTYALVEWTGRDREETSRLLGVVPTRVVMILVVSFAVAAILMTVWGRVGSWRTPIEAIARVNVLWTVGSIGAALGDILSDGDSSSLGATRDDERRPPGEPGGPDRVEDPAHVPTGAIAPNPDDKLLDGALVETLYDQFEDLHAAVEGRKERRDVEHLRVRTSQAAVDDVFGDRIRKYTSRDIAEAFVGSIVFSIPFLVEDGVFDVADYFLSFRVGGFPVFFLLNAAFVLTMVTALVYWAGPQDVEVSRPLFGFLPRRLVGIAVVSFLTAAALMTMWGRVGDWQDPVVAVARVSAVWTVASFGAALGDILPGESSGDDINDDLAELGDLVGKSE